MDEFKSVAANYGNGDLSLLPFNVRSCRRNFSSFATFLCSLMFKFSLIILVETWLKSGTDCSFDITGYKQVNLYRNNLVGGIKFFYDEMFSAEVINELTFMNDCMEVLTLFLIGINFKYIICIVYRSTGADPVRFNEDLMGRGKQTTIDRIITDDGCIVEGPSIVTHFNKFFTGVVLLITQDLPLEINFGYFRNIQHVAESCFFYPADANEVMAVIKSIPNKGNSLVDIKPKILLMIPDIVGPLVANVHNLGICDGIYPDALKIGRVTPAFKSGEVKKMNNYRPISNLLTINKIFELLTYRRMIKFIDQFDILSDLRYGFRKAKNTTQTIFRVVGDILRTFNEKSYTIALFVDLRKAFDAVNREILMYKLSLYGFRGVTNKFLSSYLTNRRQYVNINNHNAEIELINVGVPQGSVLGPSCSVSSLMILLG